MLAFGRCDPIFNSSFDFKSRKYIGHPMTLDNPATLSCMEYLPNSVSRVIGILEQACGVFSPYEVYALRKLQPAGISHRIEVTC